MALIRPRLTDHYGIMLPQAELEFAIPFLGEDIPLYVDPFLLWKSPSQQDNALHTSLINAFNHLGYLVGKGLEQQAIQTLIAASECDEVGLGRPQQERENVLVRVKPKKSLRFFDVSRSMHAAAFVILRKFSFLLREFLKIVSVT